MNFVRMTAAALMFCASAEALWAQAQPNPGANPNYGQVTLNAGFTPDPLVRNVTAGGTLVTQLGGVKAHVSPSPDFRLNYTAGNFPLTIRAESSADTTLLINLPNGQWIANDDGGGNLNPAITLPKPQSGRYDIFVGTFGKNSAAARLIISELGRASNDSPNPNPTPNPPAAGAPNPSLNPTYGSTALSAGFTPDPFVRALTAGGPLQTQLGGVKSHVAQAPDFRLNYTAGNFPLTIRAESAADTTLLINLPNGQWIANDDGGQGTNPSITLPSPQSGRYDIYVGTFGSSSAPARLIITELK